VWLRTLSTMIPALPFTQRIHWTWSLCFCAGALPYYQTVKSTRAWTIRFPQILYVINSSQIIIRSKETICFCYMRVPLSEAPKIPSSLSSWDLNSTKFNTLNANNYHRVHIRKTTSTKLFCWAVKCENMTNVGSLAGAESWETNTEACIPIWTTKKS
jgi:hypothetical protein